MKITKTELAKIVKEETETYLSEYEEPPGQNPDESWYGKKPPGAGAEFDLGAFIIKLDNIQPGLGKELDSILTGLNVANKQTP